MLSISTSGRLNLGVRFCSGTPHRLPVAQLKRRRDEDREIEATFETVATAKAARDHRSGYNLYKRARHDAQCHRLEATYIDVVATVEATGRGGERDALGSTSSAIYILAVLATSP